MDELKYLHYEGQRRKPVPAQESNWLLLRTKPNREEYAAENVKRQGCEFFLPKFFDEERRRIATLFPSYLFVLTQQGQWSFLLGTYGVAGVVMAGENPGRVPKKIVDGLMRSRNSNGLIKVPPRRKFRFNQRVRITQGAFIDYIGIYQGTNYERRVRVLLDLMGRFTPVLLDERQLSPV